MTVDPTQLRQGLDALGAMLDAIGESVELAVVGGGALVLSGVHVRPTEDLDVVAQKDGRWRSASDLPAAVIGFVRDVGRAYDLPLRQTGWEHDWLNATVSFLMPDDLPDGFFERTTVHEFGGLKVHVPARSDLVALKVLSATRAGRGAARSRDVQDLARLRPDEPMLQAAIRWVGSRRPTRDYWPTRVPTLLDALGHEGLTELVKAVRASLADAQDE